MKFKGDVDFTYMGYLHNAWYADDAADSQEIGLMLENFRQFSGLAPFLLPMFFVIDYTRKNYLVFTDSIKPILGYDAREMLENGLSFTLDIMQKDYFKTLNENVFPANFQFLKSIPQAEHKDYIFTYNNQYRDSNGKWINMLQKGGYVTSKETGMPLYSMGIVVDINAYKKDTAVVHTIEQINNLTRSCQVVETNYFYPYREDALLTRHERNIALYLADGLSSKMISDKLNIAENTVANHRKNMLRKTNTKNVAQLIAFVVRNNII